MSAWRHAVAEIDSAHLSYSRRGHGSSGVVVLHGQFGDRSVVRPLVEKVAGPSVVTPDIRGRGQTICRDPGLHTWEQYTADVRRLLDHVEFDTAVLVGVSLGAGLAIATALTHPDRVEGLVLWASPYRGHRQGWADDQRSIQGPLIATATRILEQGPAAVPIRDDPQNARRWHRHDPESIAAALVGIGWSQPFDDPDDFKAIPVPALVIPGGDALHDPELAYTYVDALPRGSAGQETPTVITDFIATLADPRR